jgi:hypothetical protein
MFTVKAFIYLSEKYFYKSLSKPHMKDCKGYMIFYPKLNCSFYYWPINTIPGPNDQGVVRL